jgi:chromosome segregation ATPase
MAASTSIGGGVAAPSAVDRHFDDIVTQSQHFEHYEKIFQEAILDIENDDALETFRHEYESLHSSFLKCHEGEKRLIKKCQDLSAEISSCVLKVRAAEELSQGDQNTIEQLKKEIDKAKSKISQSKETEVTLKERIKQLKLDIKELDTQLKKGPASVVGQDTSLAELARAKADLQKEHDTQKAQLVAIQHDITHLEGRVQKVSDEKLAQDNELLALQRAIDLKSRELDDQRKRKEGSDDRLKSLKENLTKASREHTQVQTEYDALIKDLRALELQLSEERKKNEEKTRDLSNLQKQIQKTQQEMEELAERNENLKKENSSLNQRLKQKDSEVMNLRKDQQQQAKNCDAIDKRNIVLEAQRAESQAQRDLVDMQVRQMEEDIASITREAETDRKQLEDLTRERDILNKNYLKAQSATQRQKDWLMVKENQRRNLDHQLRGYERHAQKQRELISQLAKEAKTYEDDAEIAAREYVDVLDLIRDKENDIVGKQKEIQDVEAKLRQQQTNLDNVLNERNLFAKNALQLQQEINEMTRKFRGMQTMITSLKKQISIKESELRKKDAQVSALIEEKGRHETSIDTSKKITEKLEKTIEKYNDELHKLNQIIAEAGTEKSKQRRDHVNVLNERDILGAQLIKRNDELAKLYEQIRIQQSTLRKGEAQYGDRLRDIQHLNFRVQQLRQELNGMREFAHRLPVLKQKVNQATRELRMEECRVRSLLDEADNPRNVHRFRQLEGSEPQTQQLFQRVKELQEELLHKTAEVDEKDSLIEEKEKLYKELREIISRQPGPEVAEQLNVYQDSLQKKSGQLRAMKDSLSHFQDQVKHYKARFDELQEELRDLNNTYVAARKKQDRDYRRQATINEMLGRPADAPPEGVEEEYTGYTAPPRPRTVDSPDAAGGEGRRPLTGDIPALSGTPADMPPGTGAGAYNSDGSFEGAGDPEA